MIAAQRPEPSSERDDSLVELGRRAREAGESFAALRRFNEATAADPDDPVGFVETAMTLREMRLTGKARAELDAVLPRWPDRWDLLIELARVASAQGDTARALTAYDRVIEIAPTAVWAEPYIGAANQLRLRDRLEEAEARLDRGMTVCSEDDAQRTHLFEARSVVCAAAGRHADAVQALTASISLSGRLAPVWDAAAILTQRGDFAGALRFLRDLQPVVRTHCSDSWTYDKYIDAVEDASRLAGAIEHRSRYDSSSRLLRLEPYSWAAEHPLDSLPDSLAHPDWSPARHYTLVDTSAETQDGRAFPITFEPPLSSDDGLFPYPYRRRQRAHFTYVLPRAHIFDNLGTDPRALVLFDESAFVPDLLAYHYPAALGRLALRDPSRAAAEPIPLAFMLPSGSGWLNYYHAVADIFSALTVYRSLGCSCPIVTPGPMGRVHWDLLRASGIPEETPLVSADQIRDRTIDVLISPESAGADHLRDWCAEVVSRVPRATGAAPRPDILYVSRRHAPIRSLANEAALQDALASSFGAEIVPMEYLAFDTQVDLARSAKVIIGPHGAGLTNVCFAAQGTWLVELLPDRHPVPIFRDLAAAVGARYVPVGGRVEDLDSLAWSIDVDKVLDVVAAVLDQP